jgi:S-adenosylmethionine hydrolase
MGLANDGGSRFEAYVDGVASVIGHKRRAETTHSFDITWHPERLSASFHGRDLFAPVAAMLARGDAPPGRLRKDGSDRQAEWPDDFSEVVYIDHFGNAMTGLRTAMVPPNARLAAAGRILEWARTFSDLPPGMAFWYENSNGLVEIAVNQGRADRWPHVAGSRARRAHLCPMTGASAADDGGGVINAFLPDRPDQPLRIAVLGDRGCPWHEHVG